MQGVDALCVCHVRARCVTTSCPHLTVPDSLALVKAASIGPCEVMIALAAMRVGQRCELGRVQVLDGNVRIGWDFPMCVWIGG